MATTEADPTPEPKPLTAAGYRRSIASLCARDARLAAIVAQYGTPPFWMQPDGFPGLTWAILGQQVSIESAQAAFDKLAGAARTLTPATFLPLSAVQLKALGFSRRKADYVRTLAEQIAHGRLDLDTLRLLNDDEARAALTQLRGVGRWTADTYLLFSLRRPDVWPSGDLALEKVVSELEGRTTRLATEAVDRIAARWKPWRAVAARLLWFRYLSQRGRVPVAPVVEPQSRAAARAKN